MLQVYAAKSNEEKQCNVQRDENGRKSSEVYREKWENAVIKRKKSAKLRCGSRGGKAQNFAKDERGDSIGVPPESGAEKSQKTVIEKSADAA